MNSTETLDFAWKLLTHLTALVGGGVGLWAFIALAKKLTPWLSGKTAILRAGGMVMSALGVVLAKAATGSIEGVDIQTFATSLLDAAVVWVTAHGTHQSLKDS